MKPVCRACEAEYRPHQNGVNVVEVIGPSQRPYKLWKADALKCPGCGHEIVAGFGARPFASDWDENFAETAGLCTQHPHVYVREIPTRAEATS